VIPQPSELEKTLIALRIGLKAKPAHIYLTVSQAKALMTEITQLQILLERSKIEELEARGKA
jgi:hypothetical protein